MSLDSILKAACGNARSILELAKQVEPNGQYAAVLLSLLAQYSSELREVADRLNAQQEHVLTLCEVILAAFEELEIPLNSALLNCSDKQRTAMLERAAIGFATVAKRQLPYLPVEFFCAETIAESGGYERYRAPPKASDILAGHVKHGSVRLVTVRDIATHTNLSASSVRRMVKQAGFPVPKQTRPAKAWSYDEAKAYATVHYRTTSGRDAKLNWRD